MRKVKVAATQMSCSWNREEVLDKAEKLVRKAAAEGANIILLQEMYALSDFLIMVFVMVSEVVT